VLKDFKEVELEMGKNTDSLNQTREKSVEVRDTRENSIVKEVRDPMKQKLHLLVENLKITLELYLKWMIH